MISRKALQTYLLTCVCEARLSRFQVHANAETAFHTVLRYASEGKYELHAAVIMPDHLHAVLTPAKDKSLEACVSLIKGGISFRLRDVVRGTLWQDGYHDVRIRHREQLLSVVEYVKKNPERRGLREWPFMFVQESLRG